jgi:hypothetical protein
VGRTTSAQSHLEIEKEATLSLSATPAFSTLAFFAEPDTHANATRICSILAGRTLVLHNWTPKKCYTAPPTVDGLFWNSISNNGTIGA